MKWLGIWKPYIFFHLRPFEKSQLMSNSLLTLAFYYHILDDRKRCLKENIKTSWKSRRKVCMLKKKKYHSAALSLRQMLPIFWNKCNHFVLFLLISHCKYFMTNNLVFILEKIAEQQTSKRPRTCKFGKWLCGYQKSWMCHLVECAKNIHYSRGAVLVPYNAKIHFVLHDVPSCRSWKISWNVPSQPSKLSQ